MQVALFWDFENIHASVMAHEYGEQWYNDYGYKPNPNIVRVKEIVDYANGIGNLVLNRAYANWRWLSKYGEQLNENAIELIQLFPRGHNSKNGADILLSIDIIEYLNLLPKIDVVIIVSGDSDFIPIGKRVRRQGKEVIGIGVRGTSNRFWIKTCNEFKFYFNIVDTSLTERSRKRSKSMLVSQDVKIDDARILLLQAVNQLARNRAVEWISQVMIKPMMIKLDPSFDEKTYSYNSFGEFIKGQLDLLEIMIPEGKQPEYRILDNDNVHRLEEQYAQTEKLDNSVDELTLYSNILRKQNIKLPSPPIVVNGIKVYAEMIGEDNLYEGNSEINEDCYARLDKLQSEATEADVKKLRTLFHKCTIFRKDEETEKLGFHRDIGSEEELAERLVGVIVNRIVDNIDGEINLKCIAEILFGESKEFSGLVESVFAE